MFKIYFYRCLKEMDMEIKSKNIINMPRSSAQDIYSLYLFNTKKRYKQSSNYTFINKLCIGSVSYIYTGKNKSGELVVIKKISKTEEWKKEISNLLHIRGKTTNRVIKLYDYFETRFNIFIITSFNNSVDLLSHCMEIIPYSEYKSLQLFREMCYAIKECHDLNVVHLDVKLDNFLVNPGVLFSKDLLVGTITLIDFGHSEYINNGNIETMEKLKSEYGTEFYSCPESVYFKKFSSKSDIWSLGICYAILVNGIFPFEGIENSKMYYENCITSNFSLRKLSSLSYNIIKLCLNPIPKKRPNINTLILYVELYLKIFYEKYADLVAPNIALKNAKPTRVRNKKNNI